MRFSVYVPFAVSAVLAVLAPRLTVHLPPRRAAWALACAALVTSVGWLVALALLAFIAVAQIPEIAEEGPWSPQVLRAEAPVWLSAAVVCALVLLAGCVALTVTAVRQVRALRQVRRECRELSGHGELAVLDEAAPAAYALPGAPGRIVVTRGMLRCLDPAEREALLAHERAHLRGRHYLFQAGWRLAAAANPLLRPLATAGDFVLERWADEQAAATVGDRSVVARAVARAALASAAAGPSHAPGAAAALAIDGGPVPRRVRALLAPPPRRRLAPLLAGGLLLVACCASVAEATSNSEHMVETAMRAACAPAHVQPAPAGLPHAALARPCGHGDHDGDNVVHPDHNIKPG
ncbi:MAG: hypothetical protein QOF44_1146 [Streptomyces sp.]|nr:hypothetical protein [Streptomyces sp.]